MSGPPSKSIIPRKISAALPAAIPRVRAKKGRR